MVRLGAFPSPAMGRGSMHRLEPWESHSSLERRMNWKAGPRVPAQNSGRDLIHQAQLLAYLLLSTLVSSLYFFLSVNLLSFFLWCRLGMP